jgi:hypothetical protein
MHSMNARANINEPRTPGFRKYLLAAFFGAFLLSTGLSHAVASDIRATAALPVPAAKLTEINVPVTAPMTAAAIDLAAAGYTEREFYAEGKANRYRGVLPGTVTTGQIIDGNWPYRTRVLVRAPKAEKFNGFLVVEWANVTVGQDVDFAFAESYEYLLREGYAVAVVSAQRVGVDRLKTWSPERYGTLSVAADITDPQGGGKIDNCRFPTNCPGDPLSWDVLTQVSKALKDNAGDPSPLPGLAVKHVMAMGESQSAGRLTSYYNAIQPLYKFFDGFVFLDYAGQLRSDLATPAISVNTEATAEMSPTTTTAEYTRAWAVPAASHASLYAVKYVDDLLIRDKSFPGANGSMSFSELMGQQKCKLSPLFSTVNTGLVLNAALESTRQWIKTGKAAAPTITIKRDAAGKVLRDANGNAQGGIRLAQFTAPTAFLSPNGEKVGCVLSGHHRDFTKDELKKRYGSHEAYVSQVRSAMKHVVEKGYVLPRDAEAAIRAAEDSDVAR